MSTISQEPISYLLCWDIENTSWKVLAYGIYARVVDVDTKTTRTYIPYKALSMWYCIYYIHTETFIILAAGLFLLNLSKMLKFAATHLPQNDNENKVSAF